MDRKTYAKLVELEERLIDEGVPEDVASDFIDRVEKEIDELLEVLEEDGEEERGMRASAPETLCPRPIQRGRSAFFLLFRTPITEGQHDEFLGRTGQRSQIRLQNTRNSIAMPIARDIKL